MTGVGDSGEWDREAPVAPCGETERTAAAPDGPDDREPTAGGPADAARRALKEAREQAHRARPGQDSPGEPGERPADAARAALR
ncbi:hypothetical protein I3F60_19005, partial [Streptomyces sp. MUM 136J]|nr:hypothetical protein [Streptomyces sp. MUM 136J]